MAEGTAAGALLEALMALSASSAAARPGQQGRHGVREKLVTFWLRIVSLVGQIESAVGVLDYVEVEITLQKRSC
jgi:hypothetical protein